MGGEDLAQASGRALVLWVGRAWSAVAGQVRGWRLLCWAKPGSGGRPGIGKGTSQALS